MEEKYELEHLSNPNGNARPQRKCTRSKRIYEGFEMTKITKPTTTKKRRSRKFKKPLLHVDTASSESERPSNVCVTQPNVTQPNVTQPNVIQPNVTQPNITQPNNREVSIVSNSNNIANNYPTDQQIGEYFFLNVFKYIKTVDDNYTLFPGYNSNLFVEFRSLLLRKNVNEFVNRRLGSCVLKDLYQVFLVNTWLNDIAMQHYFNLLGHKSNNTIYVLSTYFYYDLEKLGIDGFTEKYLKNVRLLNYSKILIPTHLGNHWVLVVVEVSKRKIIYYDSLDYFTSLCPKLMMLKEFLNLGHIAKQENSQSSSIITDICSGVSPKQNNRYDCGIFACMNARYNMCNKPSAFSQADIPLLRHKIFYEMVYNTLLPIE
ncbi:hypothetical protein AGLY_015908 [Aphis glycines]|uniref:Ubiquitin-like protease family profile domain-containing protein n=1 Tax=Aphis glycines TaxID=307491 RepID=A0A6G0SZ66_APHGL|nr:hypothetical protein AGLY_015908 [Aphis glycines]